MEHWIFGGKFSRIVSGIILLQISLQQNESELKRKVKRYKRKREEGIKAKERLK